MGEMIRNIVFENSTIKHYAKLLDLASAKNNLIASNIANVETPGYKKRTIDFDGELRKSMEETKIRPALTHERHIPLTNAPEGPLKVIQINEQVNSTGVNSVDIDQEMAELAQNQIIYQFGAKMLDKKFNSLHDVIRGR